MGTATRTKNNLWGGKRGLLTALAHGGSIEIGTIALASAYVTGGLTCTLPLTGFVSFEQPIPGSYFAQYDSTNNKVQVFDAATASNANLVELPSDTSVASLTSISYVCIG